MKGHLTRRGQRSWRVKYDLGTDGTGKRQTRYATLRGTRAEAQAQAAKLLATVAEGTHTDPSRETVAEFVERWLADWADDNVSQQDLDQVRAVVAQAPHRPDRSPPHPKTGWRRFADGLCGNGESRPRRSHPPAPPSCHPHNVEVRGAMECGSPATSQRWSTPRGLRRGKSKSSARPVAGRTGAIPGQDALPIVSMALASGLRRGEILALRWGDVNLDAGHLRVERTLEQTKRGGLLFKAPKTRHGRRLVTLPPSTVALLREHRRTQLEQRMLFGRGKEPTDALVFSNWDGSVRSPHWLTQAWRKAMRTAGLTGDVSQFAPHPCLDLDRLRPRRAHDHPPTRTRLASHHARRLWASV